MASDPADVSGDDPPAVGSREDALRRGYAKVLAAGLLASVALHGVLFLLPPLRTDVPAHLERRPVLEVLPPPEEPPPEVAVPDAPEAIPQPAEPVVVEGPVAVGEGEQPVFVPHDVPPRLINPDEVQDYLEVFYPVALRAANIEGAVHLWLFVDEQGEATKLQVRTSSGSRSFDQLARSAAPFMRFRPALNQGNSIGVWVSLWVRFNIEEPLPADDARLAGDVTTG